MDDNKNDDDSENNVNEGYDNNNINSNNTGRYNIRLTNKMMNLDLKKKGTKKCRYNRNELINLQTYHSRLFNSTF